MMHKRTATDFPGKQVECADTTIPSAAGQSVSFPEKSTTELSIVAAVFTASCLYFLLFYNYTTLHPDEGIILQGSQRILNGEVLYRDFFSFYTPGSYYWMALLFKVFGSSILVARAALVIYGGIFSSLTYLIARRVCSRWNAVLAIVPTVIICLPYQFCALHNWDSTLWALLALYSAVRFGENPSCLWALTLGSLTAVTCLFEQSKGAGLLVGLALGFVILGVSGALRLWTDRRYLVFLALGLVWPFLLTIAYFGAQHALLQMVSDVLWPIHHYSVVNKVPYGYVERDWIDLFHGSFGWRAFCVVVVSPLFLLPALPILAVCGLAWSTAQLWKRRMGSDLAPYYVLVSAVLSGLLVGTLATGRADVGHIVFQAPLFCLVLGWMSEAARTPFLRLVRSWGSVYLSVSLAALGLAFLLPSSGARYKLETRRGTLRTSSPDDVFKYVQTRIQPGEKILVYPGQPLYYYLAGAYSVSRYEWIVPGMHDAAQVREMIADLEAAQPRAVLFDPLSMDTLGGIYPNISTQLAAARDPVLDYLASHYRGCQTLATKGMERPVVFMVRNGLSCSLKANNLAEHW